MSGELGQQVCACLCVRQSVRLSVCATLRVCFSPSLEAGRAGRSGGEEGLRGGGWRLEIGGCGWEVEVGVGGSEGGLLCVCTYVRTCVCACVRVCMYRVYRLGLGGPIFLFFGPSTFFTITFSLEKTTGSLLGECLILAA